MDADFKNLPVKYREAIQKEILNKEEVAWISKPMIKNYFIESWIKLVIPTLILVITIYRFQTYSDINKWISCIVISLFYLNILNDVFTVKRSLYLLTNNRAIILTQNIFNFFEFQSFYKDTLSTYKKIEHSKDCTSFFFKTTHTQAGNMIHKNVIGFFRVKDGEKVNELIKKIVS